MPEKTKNLERYIDSSSHRDLNKLVSHYQPVDIADGLEHLPIEKILHFFRLIKFDDAMEIFEELEHSIQIELLESFRSDRAGQFLDEMASDERADLFEDLDEGQIRRFLASMSYDEASDVQELIQYDPDTAGGLMTTEFAPLMEDMTIKEALNFLRENADEFEQIYYAYVIDSNERLKGVVTLKNIVLRSDETNIKEIMNSQNVVSVTTDTDQEEVAKIITEYDFFVLPVVDEMGYMKGIVTIDDLIDVIHEEAKEDIERFGGVSSSEDPYLATGFFKLFWNRLPWLVVFLFISSISSFILQFYKKSYDPDVFGQLMIYLPMLIGTAGNAGTQSASIFIRGLAAEDFLEENVFSLLFRELLIGLCLGSIISIIAYFRTLITHGTNFVALSVAFATLFAVILATFIGAFLPILFKKIKLDPALMSGPFLATLMDISGLLIYFTSANIMIYLLHSTITAISP